MKKQKYHDIFLRMAVKEQKINMTITLICNIMPCKQKDRLRFGVMRENM